MEQGFSQPRTIIWWRHFHANEVIVDVRVSCIWLIIVYFNYYER